MVCPKIRRLPPPVYPWNGPGLNYGVQTFEGMKAFRNSDGQTTVFRPDQNAKRMQHSAAYISAPGVLEELFVQ